MFIQHYRATPDPNYPRTIKMPTSCYNQLRMGQLRDRGVKKIILLRPRGFCAGVVRAIDVVKIVLNLYGAPVYVRKEIVHNRHVVDELRQAGAIFVEELERGTGGRARHL